MTTDLDLTPTDPTALTLGGMAPHSMGLSTGGTGGDGIWQPLDPDLTDISGLNPSDDDIIQRKAGHWVNRTMVELVDDIGVISGFQPLDTDLTTIAGLGPMGDQDFMQYRSGQWTNRTPAQAATILASTSAAAQNYLQPYNKKFTAYGAVGGGANSLTYYSATSTVGTPVMASTPLSAYGRSLIDDADASTALSTLGVSTFAKTILDDTDAAAMRTTLGVIAPVLYATAKTVTTSIHLVAGDSSLVHLAPGVTMYLPTTPDAGQRFTVYDYQEGWDDDPVTILPGPGHTIEGETSFTGAGLCQAVTFAFSGTNWDVVGNTKPYAEEDWPINVRTTTDFVSGNKDAILIPAGADGMRMYKDGSWAIGWMDDSWVTGGAGNIPFSLGWRAKGNSTALGAIARVRDYDDLPQMQMERVFGPSTKVGTGTPTNPATPTGGIVIGWDPVDLPVVSLGLNASDTAWPDVANNGDDPPILTLVSQQLGGVSVDNKKSGQKIGRATAQSLQFTPSAALVDVTGWSGVLGMASPATGVTLSTTPQDITLASPGIRQPPDAGKLLVDGDTTIISYLARSSGSPAQAGYSRVFRSCTIPSGTLFIPNGTAIFQRMVVANGDAVGLSVKPKPGVGSYGTGITEGASLGRYLFAGGFIASDGTPGSSRFIDVTKSAAHIASQAEEDFTDIASGADMRFNTTAPGTGRPLERMIIRGLGVTTMLSGLSFGKRTDATFSASDTITLYKFGRYAKTDVDEIQVITGNLVGTATMSTVTPGDATHDEVQKLDMAASGGTFQLKWTAPDGTTDTTDPIDYNARPGAVATAMYDLGPEDNPLFQGGDLGVIKSSGDYFFTFNAPPSETSLELGLVSPTPVTINKIVGGTEDGQIVGFRVGSTGATHTFAHSTSGTDTIEMAGEANLDLTARDWISFSYNAVSGRWHQRGMASSGSGGAAVPVQENGTPVVATPTAINFLTGFDVSAVGSVATIDIDESELTGIPQASVTNLTTDMAAKQPLDSDLTSIAALTTTTFGRSLLTQADASATLATIGAQAAGSYQPLDSDLTAIAALTTDSFGRGLLPLTTATAVRTYIGAGTGSATAIFVTPEDFGATGNGSTDDSTAITNWLASDNPKRAPFDADLKNYLVAGTFTIAQSDDIDFGGATLSCKNSSTTKILVTANNVTLRNLVFDGRRTGTSVVSQGITWSGTNGRMIDCEASNHNDNDAAVLVNAAGAELTCVRCAAHNNGSRATGDSGSVLRAPTAETVSISYGMDGFSVILGRLETYACKANYNSRCGLYTSATADEGCVVDLIQCKGNYSALIRTTGSPTNKNDRTYNGSAAAVCLRSNRGIAHRIIMQGKDASGVDATRYGCHIGAYGGGGVSSSGENWKVDLVSAEDFNWVSAPTSAAEVFFLRGGHNTHVKTVYANDCQGYALAFGGGANNTGSGDNTIPTGHRVDQVHARQVANPSVSCSVGRNISIGHVYLYGAAPVDIGEGTQSTVDTVSIDKISAFGCVSGVFVNTGIDPAGGGAGSVENIHVGTIEAHDCTSTASGWPNALVWLIGKTNIDRIYAETKTGGTKPNYIVKSEDSATVTGKTHFIELFEPISYNTAPTLIANTSNIVIRLQPYAGSKALVTDASGYITPATVTSTELGYLAGAPAAFGTFVATPSSANFAALITDETGTGLNVFATSPTLTTPVLNSTPATDLSTTAVASTAHVRAQKSRIEQVAVGQGAIALTMPEGMTTGNVAIGTGTQFWNAITLKKGDSITNCIAKMTVVGATLSLAKMCIATVSGTTATVAAVSANVTSTFTSGANKWAVVPCAYTVPADGLYYIGILVVGTTGPTIIRTNPATSIQIGSNPFTYGTTGSQTDLVLSTGYTVATNSSFLLLGVN